MKPSGEPRSFGRGVLWLACLLVPFGVGGCSDGGEGGAEIAVAQQALTEPAVAQPAVEVADASCGLTITTSVHGVNRKGFRVRIRVTGLAGADHDDCDVDEDGRDGSHHEGHGHDHHDHGESAPSFKVLVHTGDATLVHVEPGSFETVENGYLLSSRDSRRDHFHDARDSYTFELELKGKYSTLTANIISKDGVSCDQAPPTVALTTSGDFFTSNAPLTLSAVAADNVAVAKVVFSQDGVPIATDQAAPYSYELPVTSALNGRHRYGATAYDLTGNVATASESVLVAIGNKFFGTAAGNDADYPVLLTYFNQLTPGNAGKWGSVEATRDEMSWTELDTAYNFAKSNGIPFKLHTLVWGSQQPSWIEALPVDEQRAEIQEWFAALAERYPDVDLIDVVNEPLHAPPAYAAALGGDGATGWDWLIASFQMARQYFPESELLLNEYNVLQSEANAQDYVQLVTLLQERGLIDGIGEQGHFYERTPELASLAHHLDVLAATGLPIYISELDVNIADDACQAVRMSQLFPTFWEHPSVVGVTHWGYLQGNVWRPDSWLLRTDGTPRASLNWLECYLGGGTDCPLAACVPPAHAGNDRSLVVEAEEFDSAHALQASGSVVAFADDGSWMSFDRVVFNDNWDKLSVTFGRNATAPASLTFHVGSLDNPPVAEVPLSSTGGWMTFQTASVPWALASGEQRLFVRFNGGGANVDKIEFSGPAPPFQMSNGEVLIEAEDFHGQESNGSGATWTPISNPLASGGKSLDLRPDNSVAWTSNVTTTAPRLDYRVNFTSTGTFTFWVRGSGENGGNDSCYVGVDGALANIHVSGSNNGSLLWTNDTFGTVARITVATPGVHTVSIWGREDGFEIDKLLITNGNRVPTGDGTVPPFQMSGGEVLIEAEAFHSQQANGSGATWTVISNPLASAGSSIDLRPDSGAVWTSDVTTTSPRVDYPVNFTSTGTFTFWLRGSGENGGNDTAFVGVDGALANIHVTGSSGGSLLWANGTFGTVAKITVATPGVHTVSIWGREDGFEVDKLLITSSDRVPTGDGSVALPFQMSGGEVLIEAEAFHAQQANGSSATWTKISNPLASGGESIDLRPDSGVAWTSNVTTTAPRVDYQVNFTSTGTFTFWVRGGGENGGNDTCYVGVDGALANIHVSGSIDGSLLWTNNTFGTVAKITVATPGVHTVSLWGREDGFEVDKILITSSNRIPTGDGVDGTTRWVGTWGSGQQLTEASNLPPLPGLANNTLRQFVYVSVGGSRLRVRFSNLFGNGPVTLNSVHVAVPTTGSGIDTATDRALAFSSSLSVTIPAGQERWSDAFDFNLAAQSRLAVSINFGSAPSDVTGHPGSRTTSYLQSGNVVSAATLSGSSTDHWYHLTAVDVAADEPVAALVTLGDSITDGRGSTTNGNNRWPDVLSRALRVNGPTTSVAVVNQGIGGNGVFGGLGPSAVARFQRDVLGVSGVKWVIVMEGVNDIGGSANTQIADQLISAYQGFITQAHAANLRIYGVPILPLGGSSYDTPDHEAARQTVNAWVRTSGAFDAVIDLDAVVRDPQAPTILLPAYDSGDHLHPSVAGHQALGEGIPLSLFAP